MVRSAVFLDRDDTLIACNELPPPAGGARGDLVDPGLVRLLPGVRTGCERLVRAGLLLVVVSNQGSVARGAAGVDQVCRVNARVRELLRDCDGGELIRVFYFCPFHPRGRVDGGAAGGGEVPAGAADPRASMGAGFTAEHSWRKPGAGMLRAAAGDLAIDLASSWMIGDSSRDIEAALAAGLARERCLLLGTDAPGFSAAAERILGAPS